MKKISLLIVQVEEIYCDKPRSDFSESILEAAARLILDGGGVITPLILRRKNIDSFELVSGYFEYYAAVKASELDAIGGQTINVYVIEANNQSIMEAQVKMFRDFQVGDTSMSTIPTTDTTPTGEDAHFGVEQSLTQNVETVLTPLFNQWTHQLQNSLTQTLTHQVSTILESLLVPINQQFNELIQRVAKLEKERSIDKPPTAPLPPNSPATDSPLLIALNQLSEQELRKYCKDAHIYNHKTIANAILAQRQKQTFGSEEELRATKGVGEKAVKKLVDYFAQSPIQPASEISQATQAMPQSTHASEISPPLENEQEPITPPSKLEQSPIQAAPEVSPATQVTPPSTLASEISPPLENEQEPITSPNELEQSPIQPASEISPANQVTPASTLASESEPIPLETPSPGPKTSSPSVSLTEEEQLLATINNLGQKELIFELNRAKVKEEVIETILKQRPFASTEAIIKIKGVGKRKWETIEKWLKNKN